MSQVLISISLIIIPGKIRKFRAINRIAYFKKLFANRILVASESVAKRVLFCTTKVGKEMPNVRKELPVCVPLFIPSVTDLCGNLNLHNIRRRIYMK